MQFIFKFSWSESGDCILYSNCVTGIRVIDIILLSTVRLCRNEENVSKHQILQWDTSSLYVYVRYDNFKNIPMVNLCIIFFYSQRRKCWNIWWNRSISIYNNFNFCTSIEWSLDCWSKRKTTSFGILLFFIYRQT